MNIDLTNKVIVITGGTKGLGRGIAFAAAQTGAKIVISGRNDFDGREVAEEINSKISEAVFVKGDIRDTGKCRYLFEETLRHFGKIDGLVNYAGILPAATITDTEEKLFDDVFEINIKAAFFCAKYAIEAMLQTGGGSIVNIGSLHAYNGDKDRAAYACSKGSLLTLTKHIAKNYAKSQIRANWITMGWVATPGEMNLRVSQGRDLEWLESQAGEVIPMGRLQTVDDNIPAILLLLSDASSQITGSEIFITGGFFL